MKWNTKFKIIFSSISLLFVFACNDNNQRDNNDQMANDSIQMAQDNQLEQERMEWESNSVYSRIGSDTVLSTFSSNLEGNQLSQTFMEGKGPYTLFAPSNEAYGALSQEDIDKYMDPQNIQENNAMLYYLAIDQEITSDELRQEIKNAKGTYTLNTMQGEQITATLNGDDIVLGDGAGNKATVVQTDVEASNGIVHVIDHVLMPGDASQNAAANRDSNNNSNNNNNVMSDSTSTNSGSGM